MAENKLRIELEIIVTDQDIDDIVCTAFEGGINYWCDEAEVLGDYLGNYASDQISRGGRVKLYDYEGEEEHILTKEKFLDGIKRYVKNIPDKNAFDVKNGMLKIDTCCVDAAIADEIIQYALFKEVIYA